MNLIENIFVDGWYHMEPKGRFGHLESLALTHDIIPLGVIQTREGGSYCLVYMADKPISNNHRLDENSPLAHFAVKWIADQVIQDG